MDEDERSMSFGDHLDELRRCFIRIVIYVALIFCACLFIQQQLMEIITRPHENAQALLLANGYISSTQKLVQIQYQEAFFTYMKVVFIASLFLSAPMTLYQLWFFISAGLYQSERKYVLLFGPFSFLLFVSGCLFGYYAIIPYGLYYLGSYGQDIVSMISINPYLTLVMGLTIVMGIVFEMPLVMFFCSKVGLISQTTFRKWRKFSIVAMFIISAIITPTGDPITQSMVAIPMILLYEFGILLASMGGRKNPQEDKGTQE